MSGIPESCVRHCSHTPPPAHPDEFSATPQTAPAATRSAPTATRERDRVEMCLLSAQGWTVPRLAVHLDVCAATVRRGIRQWEARGLRSLHYARMGRPPAVAQRQQVFRALRRPQVWSSRTLSAALAT